MKLYVLQFVAETYNILPEIMEITEELDEEIQKRSNDSLSNGDVKGINSDGSDGSSKDKPDMTTEPTGPHREGESSASVSTPKLYCLMVTYCVAKVLII